MYKHRSLLPNNQWETYDRKQDIGLLTLYRFQSQQPKKVQKVEEKYRSKTKIHPISHRDPSRSSECEDPSITNFCKVRNNEIAAEKQASLSPSINNKKLKKKVTIQEQRKIILQNAINMQKDSANDKKHIKIEHYRFGQTDREPRQKRIKIMIPRQLQSNRSKPSIREKLYSFVNKKYDNCDPLTTFNGVKRYRTIGSQRTGSRNDDKSPSDGFDKTLTPERSIYPNIRQQTKSKQTKYNYWDFTLSNFDSKGISTRHRQQEGQFYHNQSKLGQKSKVFTRQMESRRRETLYRSNLLKTFVNTEKDFQEINKQIQLNDENKIKQIIKKYFSSKNKPQGRNIWIKIQQVKN